MLCGPLICEYLWRFYTLQLLNKNTKTFFSSASLDHTAAWLQVAAAEEAAAAGARSESSCPDVSATAVLDRAFMRLLRWDPQDRKYPEVSNMTSPCTLQFRLRDILLIGRKYLVPSRTPTPPPPVKACDGPLGLQSDELRHSFNFTHEVSNGLI